MTKEISFEEFKVRLGTYGKIDYRKTYVFQACQLAEITDYSASRSSNDRGTDYILYKVRDGFRVFIKIWSRWQGESDYSGFASFARDEDNNPIMELDTDNITGEIIKTPEEVKRYFVALFNEAVSNDYLEDIEERLD